jgi:glutamate synthase (NADPH/NADH) small chain
LEGTERGLLKTDEFGHTTVEGTFGAGDVVYGGKTVVEAVANAKKVCQSIDTYLKGLQ